MAALDIADIERIFRRQGWRYNVTEDGELATNFNGVVMLIEVEEECPAFDISAGVFITNEANRHVALEHHREVDSFLAAVNYFISDARYYRNRTTGTVIYTSHTHVRHGRLHDITMARALANAVDAVRTFSHMIDDLIHARLTLPHALDTLERAVRAADERRDSA
jgi:hypothetical protein